MTTALARSATERDALAAAARERQSWSPLLASRCGAVLATLEWLAGERTTGPASGRPTGRREPTADEVALEELAALDGEKLARHALADSTWSGTVAHTLAWCRGDADTESPLP
jgi:hypothetical protein